MNQHVILPDSRVVGTGWLLPDLRDYSEYHPKLQKTVQKLGMDDNAFLLAEKLFVKDSQLQFGDDSQSAKPLTGYDYMSG